MKKNLKEIQLNKSMKDFFNVLYGKNSNFMDDILNLMENMIGFLNEIDTILIIGRDKLQRDIFEDQVNFPLRHIIKYLFTQRHNRNFATQQLNDILLEFKHIRGVIYIEALVSSLKGTLNPIKQQDMIDTMKHLANKSGPFTNEDRQYFDDLVKKF